VTVVVVTVLIASVVVHLVVWRWRKRDGQNVDHIGAVNARVAQPVTHNPAFSDASETAPAEYDEYEVVLDPTSYDTVQPAVAGARQDQRRPAVTLDTELYVSDF